MILLMAVATATCALWVRSYFREDVAEDTDLWPENANWYWRDRIVRSASGGVSVRVWGCLVSDPRYALMFENKPGERFFRSYTLGKLRPGRKFPGIVWFYVSRRSRSQPIGSYVAPAVVYMDSLKVEVPFWAIVLPAGMPPVVWLLRRRRMKLRGKAGRCLQCGYDLRASTDRCPECGTPISGSTLGDVPTIDH